MSFFARIRRWTAARRRLRAEHPVSRKQRGVAMLIVLTWLALMISVIGEFTYGTSVDAAQAANARDELRAHYLARSSVSLSRLLIKIQQQFIDPVMGQVQKMLTSRDGVEHDERHRRDQRLQLRRPRPRLLPARDRLRRLADGVLQRLEGRGRRPGQPHRHRHQQRQGAGAQVRRTFDAQITAEDGKIDINCGSGVASDRSKQLIVYRLLMGLMYSRRFDKLFSEADTTGNFAVRTDVARAIIDWADGDEQMFSPEGGVELRGLSLRRPRRPLPRARQQLRHASKR